MDQRPQESPDVQIPDISGKSYSYPMFHFPLHLDTVESGLHML
jgi:hypothetical protein